MINLFRVKSSPWLMLGVLLGVMGFGVAPAKAQSAPSIYEEFNNAKVAYVTNENEFYNAIWLLTKLPRGGQAPSIIRFVKAGVYHLSSVNNVLGAITYSIEGPGSFYMDASGQQGLTTPLDARTLKYGVTITPLFSPSRFIAIDSGQTISISGVTLLGFSRYGGDGPTWTDSEFRPGSWGGTILNNGTLTLTNVTIANSRAYGYESRLVTDDNGMVTPDSDRKGGSALGGAIYNSGTLTMRGCTIFNSAALTVAFDDGTAAMGGAVYSTGTLDVANCTFDNNHAYGNVSYPTPSGLGMVDNDYGTFALPPDTFGDHLLAGGRLVGGGAIAIDGGSANMQNITVTANTAEAGYTETETDGAYGGGVYWKSGFSNPWSSIFRNNGISTEGTRPNFQYKPPSPYKPQFNNGKQVGPNVASGVSVPVGIFSIGLGGFHNIGGSGTSYLTPLQDNGGPTLTRAPISINSPPVDFGSIPHTGNTPAQVANYLDGIDQRGAKRVIKGSSPNSTDTSAGDAVVDVGAVEAQYSIGTGNPLIKLGGNTSPFIERPSDSGTTPAGDDTTGPIHDVTVDGIVIKDVDEYTAGTSQNVEVTIDFPDGKIITDFSNAPGVTVKSLSEDGQTVVLVGTIDDINAALAGGLLLYRSDATVDYPPDFSITVNDLGNYGYGGDKIYSDITTNELIDPIYNPAIYITPQNHAPHVSVPGTQYVKLNAGSTDYNTLVFSRENGNAINVSDPDINAPIVGDQGSNLPPGYDRSSLQMQVTISATNGSLSLGNGSAISIIDDPNNPGNGSSSITMQGTVTALNLALEGMSYRPNPGTSTDTITIKVNDLGNYGEGGSLTASNSILVKVTKDGEGGDHSSSVRWEVSEANYTTNGVELTYRLLNLSNTDITNIIASGSISGGGYFDTSGATFSPSVGYATDINWEYSSPTLQRQLDPTKNGLSVTWALIDDDGNPYVLRQGKSIFLRITVPSTPSVIGKQVTGSWSVDFTSIDSGGNATQPSATPPVKVSP